MRTLKRAKLMKQQTQVIHYPRLDTILMVEKVIKDAPDCMTKTQLWGRGTLALLKNLKPRD